MVRELDRITVNPQVCLGQPTIRGMRITVGFVLKLLASQRLLTILPAVEPELAEGAAITVDDDTVRVRKLSMR